MDAAALVSWLHVRRPLICSVYCTHVNNQHMQNTPGYTGTLGEKPKIITSDGRDHMGLTSGQRTFAWLALAAGIITLVIAMAYTPDSTQGYDSNRQNSSISEGVR
jgi:hypothetical protein